MGLVNPALTRLMQVETVRRLGAERILPPIQSCLENTDPNLSIDLCQKL
jgi:hypothetical protein